MTSEELKEFVVINDHNDECRCEKCLKLDYLSKRERVTMEKISKEDNDWMNAPMGKPVVVGYKSLRGFIRVIKSQNKKLRKLNCKVTFTITLPIPD